MIKKALVIILAATSCAFADNHQESDVNNFVQSTADKVLQVVKADYSDSVTESELTKVFQDVMDIEWMAKFALGKRWLGLDPKEQQSYLENYKNYLTKMYVPSFKKYNGQSLNIKGVKPIGNNYYIVTTEIKSESANAPVRVEYRVKNSDNKYKVRDIMAEGVSLINTQRSDFNSIVSHKGIAELNSSLMAKVQ